jgi:hypothetical protein
MSDRDPYAELSTAADWIDSHWGTDGPIPWITHLDPRSAHLLERLLRRAATEHPRGLAWSEEMLWLARDINRGWQA